MLPSFPRASPVAMDGNSGAMQHFWGQSCSMSTSEHARHEGAPRSAPLTRPDEASLSHRRDSNGVTRGITTRLARCADQVIAPAHIIHLGLGNFFRAHQAWYTAHAPDSDQWGIAAFTGRRPEAAHLIAPQDGLYTLITRGRDGDELEVIDSISQVHIAGDHSAWLGYFRDESVSIVTLTVTEAGYVRRPDGGLDVTNPVVAADIRALQGDHSAPVSSVPGKLVAGLLARQAAECGSITILPCDNLPQNGAVVARVVKDLAVLIDSELASWIDEHVDFATSMVDRITPATTNADRDTVRNAFNVEDASPVTTEAFSEWVISGTFPAGRPAWEEAGARFVDDAEPFARLKLFFLNGSHSLLAYGASIRGHETVSDAINDERCRAWVEAWWDDARPSIELPDRDIEDYRATLLLRYENPRIRHLLAQIASDGSQKIPVRIVPVIEAERQAGRMPAGAVRALASCVSHLRGLGVPLEDVAAKQWQETASGEAAEGVCAVLAQLGLDDDHALESAVLSAVLEYEHMGHR